MAQEFTLQDPGEGIHEAEILEVHVAEGDTVEDGDIVLTVETDKASVEIPSPYSGAVTQLAVQAGDTVQVGELLMVISSAPEEDSEQEEEPPEHEEQDASSEPPEHSSKDEDRPEHDEKPKKKKKKKKKKRGDKSTTKGTESEERERDETTSEEEDTDEEQRVLASPVTRRLARERGVDLAGIEGSGPGGRIEADDVRAAASREHDTRDEQVDAETDDAPTATDYERWGHVERVPLRGVRRATAEHLTRAWNEIPHVSHEDVADITDLERLRQSTNSEHAENQRPPTLTAILARTTARVLREFPRFNASLDPERGEIVRKDYINLGIAVDTEQGLLVPVIRNVDRKSILELSAELDTLTQRARAGELKPDELRGGTFTITNPGPFGGRSFTPLINHPEVAILGIAAARLEPTVQGDLDQHQIIVRQHLPLILAFDHRVNDGADAARFTRRLIELLEAPDQLALAL